jgi:hypothetical protein
MHYTAFLNATHSSCEVHTFMLARPSSCTRCRLCSCSMTPATSSVRVQQHLAGEAALHSSTCCRSRHCSWHAGPAVAHLASAQLPSIGALDIGALDIGALDINDTQQRISS